MNTEHTQYFIQDKQPLEQETATGGNCVLTGFPWLP